jgi:MSHA biogenesis protein MshN
MSVINKMLQDLDKRGAAQGRPEVSLRGTGIPLETGAPRGRWKIAAWALIVPLVLAAGWVVLRPGSVPSDRPAKTPQSVPLAQVAPKPAEIQAKADVVAQAPTPKPQAPEVVVTPSAPPAKPEPSAPAAQAQTPAVATAPVAPMAKPQALATSPQAPVIAAVPAAPVVKPPAPAPAPPPQAPVIAAAPPAPPAKPQPSAPTAQAKTPAAAVPAAPVVPSPAQAPSLPQAPVVAAAPPKTPVAKAPVLIAQASVTPEPPSKAQASAREVTPESKPSERTDSAISISKRPPAAQPAAKPKTAAPKTSVATADAKPSAPAKRDTGEQARTVASAAAPAADAGRAGAPTRDAAKSSISVERQDPDSSRRERVSAEYRNAVELMNQGRAEPAIDAYAGVLRLDPKHAAARQALVALLMGRGRGAEAQGALREGLAVLPENTAWAMLLARLQVEGGDKSGALATLDGALPYAKNRPDYQAFVGTVLQLQGRHKDAIAHYEVAVHLSPDSGRWLTGLAISLEEEKRIPEAREAYQRALATSTLASDLRAFVERKLGQLK